MAENCYKIFKSTQSKIPVTFLYPVSWQLREVSGNHRTKIRIICPHNDVNKYPRVIRIGVSLSDGKTIEETANLFIAKYRNFPAYQVLGRLSGTIAESRAEEIDISYSVIWPLSNSNAQRQVVRECHVFCRHKEYIYELSYQAGEKSFAIDIDNFHILIQTFTFIDEGVDFHHVIRGPTSKS